MSDHQPAVSARGVLDGDPAALAGLCELRGPAVLAYCAVVCPAETAVEAAAAAFAAFRSRAVAATAPLQLDPDALLLAEVRQAAATRAQPPGGDAVCADTPRLLAAATGRTLSGAQLHHLRRHLARCVGCRALANTQREAERAYRHPPPGPLAPIARQTMIAALRQAAPIVLAPPPPPILRAQAAVQAPTLAPTAEPAPASTPPPAPRPAQTDPRGQPDAGAARVPPRDPTPPATPRPAQTGPHEQLDADADAAFPPADVLDQPTGLMPALAPARRGAAALARLPGARIFAPAGVLIVALLIILGIAGVFSPSHPPLPTSPTPGLLAPAPRPLVNTPAAHRARLHAARLRRAARAAARLRAAGRSVTGAPATP